MPYEEGLFFDKILSINKNKQYEIRLIMSINHISTIKYNSKIYSRHGGCYKKWRLQERVDNKTSLPISIDYDIE